MTDKLKNKYAVPLTPYAPGGDLGAIDMQDPRIQQARKLMQEYDADIKRQRKEEADNALCKCGHKYKEHGTSISVNYSAGFCNVEGCKCRNFLNK
jgi:hypothetical protein